MKHSFATTADYVNVRRTVVVGIDHNPEPVETKYGRHCRKCSINLSGWE